MLDKKADMSIALIVSAVIALVIIVVALAIFGKGSGDSAKTLGSCVARGGECKDTKPCPRDSATILNVDCQNGAICCLKI